MTSIMTAIEFGELLLETIKTKDAQKSIEKVQQFRENMKNVLIGADYVLWISEPVNLTKVQKALTEELNIPQRAMVIKRVLMSRTQRAVLLIQAIEMAIKRVYHL